MKRNLFALVAVLLMLTSCAKDNKDYVITIHTTFGDMKAILYDETPLHKANFIELAESGQYDSTIFHRIIKGFMVQGGGIDMKTGDRNTRTVPAEIVDGFFHHKGALAAARQGDNVNPEKASSWCQFYIIQGKQYAAAELDGYENQMNEGKKRNMFGSVIQRPENADLLGTAREYQKERNQAGLDSIMAIVMVQVEAEFVATTLTDEQKEVYTSIGGSPHLDSDYTVFGKVVEGLDIIDKIANVETRQADKPIEDYFMTVEVEKLSRKKITKLYGYEYPNVDK